MVRFYIQNNYKEDELDIDNSIKIAEDKIFINAINNFKETGTGAYSILHLLKNKIKEFKDEGKKVKDQLELINIAFSINISGDTFRNFYYIHINKKEKKKESKKIVEEVVKKSDIKLNEYQKPNSE